MTMPLPPPATLSADARERARAAFRAEVAKPRRPWRRSLLTASGTIVGLCLALAGVLLAVQACTVDFLSSRSVTLAALVTVGLVTSWASLRPQGVASRWAAVGLVVLTAVLLVVLRGAGEPSLQPPWVCTVSHLAVGLAPASVVIVLLRGMAPNRLRAILAGLAAGTTGAFAGELACGQSAAHVAVFHLSAWAAVGLAVTLISSKLTPRSYAP